MSSKYDRKDHIYLQAKAEGKRSRAYYKLEEIDKKYGFFKQGYSVVDLGAWPGGWMQYAIKKVGANGLVVGIDLVKIDEFQEKNVHCITGDLNSKETIEETLKLAKGPFDTLICDMSPKLSGIRDADQARCIALAELAIYCASQLLRSGGNLTIKVFKGNETEEFIRNNRQFFTKLIRASLKSTRKTSNEFYVVGMGFKAQDYIRYINEYYMQN